MPNNGSILETQMKGIPIGQLLVEQGAFTQRQVDHIIRVQKASHRPFGDLAERLYGIKPRAIEDAWVEQYTRTVGITNLDEHQMDHDVLRLLNRRQAWQFQTLPVNRDEETLNIATTPDNLVRAVNFATRTIDEPISFLLTERTQLARVSAQALPRAGAHRRFCGQALIHGKSSRWHDRVTWLGEAASGGSIENRTQ